MLTWDTKCGSSSWFLNINHKKSSSLSVTFNQVKSSRTLSNCHSSLFRYFVIWHFFHHHSLIDDVVISQAAVAGMTTSCKCHGVSGSCSVKTCWKSLQDTRAVGTALMNNYIFAIEVDFRRPSRRSRDRLLVPVAHTGKANFTTNDLIFYTQSPDYCLPEVTLGSVGTTER